jgi:predicted lipoprotein with Yx(FWY)xxD motif
MRRRLLVLLLLAALGAAAAVAATAGAKGAAKGGAATVALRRTKLGRILVDGSGRTLYLFMKDKHGKSACAGACAAGWPPLLTNGRPKAAHGVSQKLLGTTIRKSGRQVTYAGHPLYRYAGDSKAGQTNGEGSKAFGAAWYVLAPNGHKIDKS